MPQQRSPNIAKSPRWRQLAFRLKQTFYLMVGIPDYDRFVAHYRARHPGERVPSYEEFFRERQAKRYSGGTGGRCC